MFIKSSLFNCLHTWKSLYICMVIEIVIPPFPHLNYLLTMITLTLCMSTSLIIQVIIRIIIVVWLVKWSPKMHDRIDSRWTGTIGNILASLLKNNMWNSIEKKAIPHYEQVSQGDSGLCLFLLKLRLPSTLHILK